MLIKSVPPVVVPTFKHRLMANPLISPPNTLINSTSFVNTYAGSISVKILVSTITIIEYCVMGNDGTISVRIPLTTIIRQE